MIRHGPCSKGRLVSQVCNYHQKTLLLLDDELRHLKATAIVLQVALSEDEIRLDGQPRGGPKAWSRVAKHPGVILSFESRHGPLSYPCDTFDDWRDNLRAIALALEHLRACDRYGITRAGEQYRGWTALPAPSTGKMTRDQAIDFLARYQVDAVDVRDSTDARIAAARAAAKLLHPDREGDAEQFKRLVAAKEALNI